ncbi:MAG: hypothetical protein JRJ54_01040 [Deltaproteobacteria bacterium]|nr:hypothetical protein [Deltaproteobacteria bacterium]
MIELLRFMVVFVGKGPDHVDAVQDPLFSLFGFQIKCVDKFWDQRNPSFDENMFIHEFLQRGRVSPCLRRRR